MILAVVHCHFGFQDSFILLCLMDITRYFILDIIRATSLRIRLLPNALFLRLTSRCLIQDMHRFEEGRDLKEEPAPIQVSLRQALPLRPASHVRILLVRGSICVAPT